ALAKIFVKVGVAVYGDFQRYYGIDLGDLFRGGNDLTPKRFLYLVEALPVDSRTTTLVAGQSDGQGWGVTEYLLANVIDAVRENTFAYIQARSERKPARRERRPVPGTKRAKK